MDEALSRSLREPFPAEAIGHIPRKGVTLDYVGHATVTDRLLAVDPEWGWEPVAWAEDGGPLIRIVGDTAELWIRLTIGGVTRLGVGTCPTGADERSKQLIGDAIRNAAMRFGVALDLWAKDGLPGDETRPPRPRPAPKAETNGGHTDRWDAAGAWAEAKARLAQLPPDAQRPLKAWAAKNNATSRNFTPAIAGELRALLTAAEATASQDQDPF